MAKAQPRSIKLDEKLDKKVKEEAIKEKRSFSAQVEWIIEKYYEIKEKM